MSNHKTAVRIGGWHVYVPSYGGEVEIEHENGQHANLTEDVLEVDVHPNERGHGWDGDVATMRSIPVAVLEAALKLYREWVAPNR